jgi:signal transduction histidine kinase
MRRWGELFAPPLSVRTYMVGLMLAGVVPLLAFSAYLVLRSATHEQEILASTVRERSHAAAAAIDQELNLLRARLFILAASRHLQAGDFAAFHAQASELAKDTGLHIVLKAPDGQEIVNTRVPFGEKLPIAADLEATKHVVANGEPYISDIVIGALARVPVVAINVPVYDADRLDYVLGLDIAPQMPKIIAQLNLPDDWVAAVIDRQGRTVTRNREAARFIGQSVRPSTLERFRAADAGWFPGVSREGIPIYNAFAHIRSAGWVIGIGIPATVLFAPVRRSTMVLVGAGALAVGVALFVAGQISRRLARGIGALVTSANQLGRGERLALHPTGIRETDAVSTSLYRAAEQLHRSAAARDDAERELRASEQRYRTLAEALAAANDERTELLHRTVATQEAERRRIARELHDSFGQYLTALQLAFDAMEPICAADATSRQRLAELKHLTAELGHDCSRMAWELRPTVLDDLGLKNAIAQYIEEWAERSGRQIDLEIVVSDRRLPPAVETALFRVLQEAITNVVKHSGADHVSVILETTEGEVRLIVEDNGRGFRLDAARNGALDKSHLGLLGVRERLALLNGRLQVESTPNRGTTVYASVPLEEARVQ